MTQLPDHRLETERLVLRRPGPQDVETFMAFYGTSRAQFVGGPMTPEQAWRFFGTEIGHWEMHGYGMYVVTWKGADDALGIVGHWYPHGWPETEVGWVLFNAEDQGKGIAREAAQACIAYAWQVLEWDTVVSYISPGNDASIRLAERLGATLDPDAAQPKPDNICLVYRHPRPEGLV
ncbi:MAG: GNAT family N-acetyltransferase [Pseudomonadota bacterium]